MEKDTEINIKITKRKKNESEHKTICIDRADENARILEFQKTGDVSILDPIYKNRIPTIKSWAHKHYYPGLTFSVEDLFEDLSEVFVKAARDYDKNRGSFNTCLFTFFINRLKNIKNSRHAKKRLPDNYDGPASGMILSLDYPYNTSDGSEVTLKDVIPSTSPNETDYVLTNTYINETLDILSLNNPTFRDFLLKVSEGNSLVSLIREYKTKKGNINLSLDQAKQLRSRKCSKMVKELLKDKNIAEGDFKLLGYSVEGTSRLKYEIELKKTKDLDMIMKSLRELKKNKESYKSKLEVIR